MDQSSRPNSVESFHQGNNSYFYHYSSPNNVNYDLNQQQFWSQNNQYLTQYYSNYYRDYYRRLLLSREHQPQQPARARTPLKYGSRVYHTRAQFNQQNNLLMVLENNTKKVLNYSLSDILIDYLYPKQFFSLLLSSRDSPDASLPFRSRDLIVEWLRSKEMDLNFELKLILKVIQMLLKQNGVITGLDLSELLFELLDFNSFHSNFGSTNEVLNNYRLLLMRGQKRVALNYALNNGLNDHALALSYLMTVRTQNPNNDLMITTIKKFMANTLQANDPIYVLYSAMISGKETFISKDLSFESFVILLSNEMSLNSIEIQDNGTHQSYKNLLQLIKNLMDNREENEFILSEDLFESHLDFILINECLEFSRFYGKKFNSKLIPLKLELISLLYDFGFYENALEYCKQLKTFDNLSTTAARIIYELESRFDLNYNHQNLRELEFNNDTVAESISEVNDDNTEVDDNNAVVSESNEQTENNSNENVLTSTTPGFDFYGQFMSSPITSATPNITAITGNDANDGMPAMSAMSPIHDQSITSNAVDGDAFSFISTSGSAPVMPFDTTHLNNDYVDNRDSIENNSLRRDSLSFTNNTSRRQSIPDNSVRTSSENEPQNKPRAEQNSNTNKSSLFGTLFGKFRPRNQAILPDDKNMTLVYDKETQQWIDKSEIGNQTGSAKPSMAGPPVGPPIGPPMGQMNSMTNSLNNNSFKFKSNKRYVDVFNNK